jgi:uncharacterized protein YndB with AHSA1/START domain
VSPFIENIYFKKFCKFEIAISIRRTKNKLMQTHFKIQYKTTVNAALEKVWDALTNPEIVKQYLFGTEMITTWKVGDDIICKGVCEGQAYQDKVKVLEYVHHEKLSHSYLSS